MSNSFNIPFNRRNTNSLKWDMKSADALPVWVADMDFKSPEPIRQAMMELAESGMFGYAWPPYELYDVIIQRLSKKHNWKVKKEWIVLLPGLVPGLHAAARVLPAGRTAVMTSTPVYFYLFKAAENSGNKSLEIPFKIVDGIYKMDFEQMEANLTPDCGMYMLCNPHNPNGRVFDREELLELNDFCLKHSLILVSDEIHCDLIIDENASHISAASLSKEIEENSITLLSPSKTFNIPGMGGSFAVIPNADIRKRFELACLGIMPHMNNWQINSMIAAYSHCEPWREELIAYLKSNHDYLMAEVNSIPGLEMQPLQATYLAWIKCNKPDVENYLLSHGLAVSGGDQFHGEGYFRLNFGTQRSTLEQAVGILKMAFI